ncbi:MULTISPECIES: tetratricopeptide repeat protein [unclassified Nostoc]|uniref:CHAT domain-containing protein n=1 Tax=unclassified Nostoc TaxID=2593658 RepID=UPI001E0D5FC8|nr:tetratricopeptide repeat protein [Nostoc sp. JL23]MBN3875718.1 tetratricopeptide repeat protein [Nostoc sp. JL23]
MLLDRHRFSLFCVSLLLCFTTLGQSSANAAFVNQILAQTQTAQNPKAEADRLLTEGKQKLEQNQFQAAQETFEKALALYRQAKDRKSEGVTLYSIGDVYYAQAEFSQVIAFYEQALVIWKEVGDHAEEARTLNDIGLSYSNLSQYSKALDYYQQALAIRQRIGDHSGVGNSLNNIGAIYDSKGEYPKALDYYQQALAIMKQIGDRPGVGTILNNIGFIYSSLRQYPKALDYYQQALAIRKQIGDRSGIGQSLNNIGFIYDRKGEYPKALDYYQQALAIMKQIGDRSGVGTTLNNIGLVYDGLGQYPKALDYYQQALAIRQQIGDRSKEGTTLNNIGGIYDRKGEYSKALDYFQQALAIFKQIGDRSGVANSLNNIGFIYDSKREYSKALNYYQQALAIFKQIGDRSGVGITLNNIGFIYKSPGEYPKALDYFQQALAIFKQIGDARGQGTNLSNLGFTYYNLKQYADAERRLLAAIEIWESLRPGLTDESKISIFETQQSTYRNLQRVLVAQKKTNQALEVAEQGRAKAFIELLASRLSPDLQKQNPESLQKKFIVNLGQIKQIAQMQNASVVEYSIVSDEDLYIWVIQPTGKVAFRSVDLKKSLSTSLAKLVTSSRQSIGVRGRASIEIEPVVDAADQKKRSQQLYKLLIDPIAGLLPSDPNSHVIFIPQGQLFLVPFPALQDANGKYLIEKHTILTAPAIQVLNLTHQQRLKPHPADLQEALVVGNPTMPKVTTKLGDSPQQLSNLPGSEGEANEIAKLFKTKAFIGNQAIKAKILPKLSQAKIVHLATHGLLDDFKGLGVPGAIALAPSGNGELNDGLLTANEILDLKLNADLVVLSACDTALGQITGDGVIGLSRSLITAGTPSVIVSLWSVPDAPTAELMTEFYRNWRERKLDKAQALRQAMLKTMENHPNPKDWAAFTLIGEAE